jgi:hypothetical protein
VTLVLSLTTTNLILFVSSCINQLIPWRFKVAVSQLVALTCCAHASYLISFLVCLLSVAKALIKVDTINPENNGPFTIFNIPDMEGPKDTEFKGYLIMHRADIRFLLDEPGVDHYKARVAFDDKIYVQVPSTEYGLYTDNDREQCEKNKFITPNILKSMDNNRHKFLEGTTLSETGEPPPTPARKWKRYTLHFPDHKLSSKVIHEKAGDDDDLIMSWLKLGNNHEKYTAPMKADKGVSYFVGWKVVRTDQKNVKKGKITTPGAKKSKNMEDLESLFAGMTSR